MSIQRLACNIASQMHKITASGDIYLTCKSDGERRLITDAITLSGRTTISPDSGEEVVVFRPVVTIPRSSLVVVPASNEECLFEVPLDPLNPTVLTPVARDMSKSDEGGRSVNTIRFYLNQVDAP